MPQVSRTEKFQRMIEIYTHSPSLPSESGFDSRFKYVRNSYIFGTWRPVIVIFTDLDEISEEQRVYEKTVFAVHPNPDDNRKGFIVF